MLSLREDIKSYINSLVLTEGIETKNMSLAKHYLYNALGYDEQRALKCIGAIKTDIPNSRLCKCKFMLGLVRMFAKGELQDANSIMNLNKTLKYVASNAHVNEYNNDLNGLNAEELINRFAGIASSDLQADKDDIANQEYSLNNEYEIVKINSFDESEEYGEYVDWCVTHDSSMYNSYTKGGNAVFYFCLRNGFEDEEREAGEGCPLDRYGLSMIAVSVNSDGSCSTITCRWNHSNGGNDNIMTTKELSQVIGVNFYNVFKPLTPEEIERNKREILYSIEDELSAYMGYESPDDLGCDKRDYDPEYGDTIEEDFYVFSSEYVDGKVLIDYNWGIACNDVFDEIDYRQGDCMRVVKGREENFLRVDGELLSEQWFERVINEFDHGVGLVMNKNKLWNAITKDKEYVFSEWYAGITLKRRFNSDWYYEVIGGKTDDGKSRLINYALQDGTFIFDRWINKIFQADSNMFLKFENDAYYLLYNSNTLKKKANYKVAKLLGSHRSKFSPKYFYKIKLDNGGVYYIDKNGNLLDVNTEQVVYENEQP